MPLASGIGEIDVTNEPVPRPVDILAVAEVDGLANCHPCRPSRASRCAGPSAGDIGVGAILSTCSYSSLRGTPRGAGGLGRVRRFAFVARQSRTQAEGQGSLIPAFTQRLPLLGT